MFSSKKIQKWKSLPDLSYELEKADDNDDNVDSDDDVDNEYNVVRINDPTTRQMEVVFLNKTFSIHQDPCVLDHAAVLWDAALVLLELIEESPRRKEAMAGKRILELGGGTGLLSIALAKALGCDVTCTDLPAAMENIRKNSSENYSPIRTMVYSWGDLTHETLRELFVDKTTGEEKPFDFIVGTDVSYSEKLNPLLIKSAAAIACKSNELFSTRLKNCTEPSSSSPQGKESSCSVIFANELRCELAQEIFEKSASSCSLLMKQVPQRKLPLRWQAKQMLVFDMKVQANKKRA